MRALTFVMAIALGLVAACGAPAPAAAPATTIPTAAPTPAAASLTGPAATPTATPALARHLTFELIDVRTGERFTLGGFTGRVVLVQGLAVW